MTLSRRRFIAITAATAVLPSLGMAQPADTPLRQWRGVALGADARLILSHPDADRLIARALAELSRLEAIFSLYREDSALSRLNAHGHLDAPPSELLEVLALSDLVHRATGGFFDPSVQPLWAAHAEAGAAGRELTPQQRSEAVALCGWSGVMVTPQRVAFARRGMALTLNGIAQGFITDRIADLLRAEGLRDVLVEMGEISAVGAAPGASSWPVTLSDGTPLSLRDRAVATSSPDGTSFDDAGRLGHILDPRTGTSAETRWRLISVSAPQAAVADALSTAGCLMASPGELASATAKFRGARVERMA